jgi:hypothetical protein
MTALLQCPAFPGSVSSVEGILCTHFCYDAHCPALPGAVPVSIAGRHCARASDSFAQSPTTFSLFVAKAPRVIERATECLQTR